MKNSAVVFNCVGQSLSLAQKFLMIYCLICGKKMMDDKALKSHCNHCHRGDQCSGCYQASKKRQGVHVVKVNSGIKQQMKDLGLISDDQ